MIMLAAQESELEFDFASIIRDRKAREREEALREVNERIARMKER